MKTKRLPIFLEDIGHTKDAVLIIRICAAQLAEIKALMELSTHGVYFGGTSHIARLALREGLPVLKQKALEDARRSEHAHISVGRSDSRKRASGESWYRSDKATTPGEKAAL